MRVLRMLRREVDEGDDDNIDALAALQAAALKPNRSAGIRGDDRPSKRLTAFIEGFSLHAGVHLHANDRRGLEQLCRYGARALRGRLWRASEARGYRQLPRSSHRRGCTSSGSMACSHLAAWALRCSVGSA